MTQYEKKKVDTINKCMSLRYLLVEVQRETVEPYELNLVNNIEHL
jgi:hypothetical protein